MGALSMPTAAAIAQGMSYLRRCQKMGSQETHRSGMGDAAPGDVAQHLASDGRSGAANRCLSSSFLSVRLLNVPESGSRTIIVMPDFEI